MTEPNQYITMRIQIYNDHTKLNVKTIIINHTKTIKPMSDNVKNAWLQPHQFKYNELQLHSLELHTNTNVVTKTNQYVTMRIQIYNDHAKLNVKTIINIPAKR